MNRCVLVAAAAALAMAGCTMGALDPHPILIDALESGQPDLQAVALEAYLRSGEPAPALDFSALTDPRVRMLAFAEAGRRRDPRAVASFQMGLVEPDPSVRLAAAYGLVMAAGDGGMAIALRDGLSSPSAAVRRNAAWLIGLMDNSSAVDMLKTKLFDPDAVVVLRVAEALGRLGSSDGLPLVRSLTEYEHHAVRCEAARLLGRFGTADDIPRLRRLADDSQFLDVKFAAIGALTQLGDFRQITLLVELLDAPDKELQQMLLAAQEPAESANAPPLTPKQLRMLAANELAEAAYAPALRSLSARARSGGDLQERVTAAAAILRIQADPRSSRRRGTAEKVARDPNIFRESDLPKYGGPAMLRP